MIRLIFIPGIMGTTLYEGQKNRRWYSFGKKNVLRLKFEKENIKRIIPGNPLESALTFIGSMVKPNLVYKPILDMLRSLENKDCSLDAFGYDWRLDLFENCDRLHDVLRDYADDEIILIAHSMGGLLAHSYCQWAQEKCILPNIKKVITLATPWHGSPEAYLAIMYGLRKNCFPDADVIAEVSKTFPSIYQLLPSSQILMKKTLLERDGRDYTWKDIFAFLKSQQGCNIDDIESLNIKLHDSLSKAWPNDIKHYHLIGHDHGTFVKFRISYKKEDYADITDGDETVPVDYCIPYPAYNSECFYIRANHLGITKLDAVHKWIKGIIFNHDYQTLRNISSSYTKRDNWVTQRIACPVEVSIENEYEIYDHPVHPFSTNRIGDVTYVIYNDNVDTELTIEPYDIGLTSMETISIKGEKEIIVNKFPALEVVPSSKAIVKISFDQNGTPETIIKEYKDTGDVALVKGIMVPYMEKIPIDLPKTICYLKKVGERIDSKYFSHEGVLLSFKAIPGNSQSQILETIYTINQSPKISYRGVQKHLKVNKELVYGKNIVTFYSKDIYGNLESTGRKDFFVEPPRPVVYSKISLNQDSEIYITFTPSIEGVRNYEYKYLLNDGEEEIICKDRLELRFQETKEIRVKATDHFGSSSDWIKLNLDLSNLIDYIWNPNAPEITINAISKKLPKEVTEIKEIIIGNSLKNIEDKIPKNAKNITFVYDQCEYNIPLVPSYDIFLDYHSEIIKRENDIVKISFVVFDSDGTREKELKPLVKYSYVPIKNHNKDVQIASVKHDGKGVYSFTISVKYLSPEVDKIKFEFRDSPNRIKPLKTKEFKLQ